MNSDASLMSCTGEEVTSRRYKGLNRDFQHVHGVPPSTRSKQIPAAGSQISLVRKAFEEDVYMRYTPPNPTLPYELRELSEDPVICNVRITAYS